MLFMKAIVNGATPLTDKESSDFLDTIYAMLKTRHMKKRTLQIKKLMQQ